MLGKRTPLLILLGGLLLTVSIVLWAPAVSAQCGSETSSCKNCHEVQGQDPVNNDGTGWHESHAFGDFCYICHAGNLQATTIDAAHEGMVPPMSDIKASCQSCHPSDLDERAAVYTAVLGVDMGTGNEALATLATTPIGEEAAPPADESAEAVEAAAPVVEQPAADQVASVDCAPIDTQLAVNDPNVVDYVQHYNQVVLGEYPVNWGDVALIGIIALVVLGGGGFVLFNETRLHRISEQTSAVEGEYPADVVEMLPALTNLKPQARKSLKNILSRPEKSDRLLGLIDAAVSKDDTEE